MTQVRPSLTTAADRLQSLIDAVTDCAIYMLDERGHIATWNSGAEKIKGYRESEILGLNYSLFFTAEDRAAGLPARDLDIARRDGKHESEGWRVRKDGTRFVAATTLHAIHDANDQVIGF